MTLSPSDIGPIEDGTRDVETLEDASQYKAPAFSDEALALEFAKQHAGDLRFVAAWNKWLVWNGRHWQFEETLLGPVFS
jgi:phage/plasmid-associated DNA primase